MPPISALAGERGGYFFSDSNLREIYFEALRRRRWWRVRHYTKLAAIVALLVWTFALLPRLAWPQ